MCCFFLTTTLYAYIHSLLLSFLFYFSGAETYTNKNETEVAILQCSKGFYQDNSSNVCIPSCYTLVQFSENISIFFDVMIFLSAFIGFLAAMAVIIISCLAHKRM